MIAVTAAVHLTGSREGEPAQSMPVSKRAIVSIAVGTIVGSMVILAVLWAVTLLHILHF